MLEKEVEEFCKKHAGGDILNGDLSYYVAKDDLNKIVKKAFDAGIEHTVKLLRESTRMR